MFVRHGLTLADDAGSGKPDSTSDATGTTRVVCRTEITGPAADQVGPQLGPAVTADFPEVISVELAESLA